MLDLTPLVNALVALGAAAITLFLIPWLINKSNAEKRGKLVFWLETAVKAAEEYFSGPGRGQEKKDYVLKFLCDKGYKINVDEIAALINSTVWELINQYKAKTPDNGTK